MASSSISRPGPPPPNVGHRPNPNGAGPSETTRPANPQMGPEPWFAYPTPTPDQLDDELPPYFESENVPLGPVLDRLTRKGHGDLRGLLEHTLPASPLNHRPKHIIGFAKSQRQAILKYLAILRWKVAVDVPIASCSSQTQPIPTFPGAASFPTPLSNGESNTTSPAAGHGYVGKGKGRATEEEERKLLSSARGKVTDAKRVTHFMEHQNRQHEMAVAHVEHVTQGIESLRERNPDLLTAVSLLTLGTYSRLPTSLTEPFKPPSRLTNRIILRTLRHLNRHLRYRLKCVDYLPPELTINEVRDGKVYICGGGEHGWKAQMTVVGFGQGEEGRWWLTGVEWGWREKPKGIGDDGIVRSLSENERQQILDVVNGEVLSPILPRVVEGKGETTDAPLVRLYNFLQHLSLSYQLETLCTQALALSAGKWRGQLLVDLDRQAKVLKLRYWVRQRPAQPPAQSSVPGNERNPQQALVAARQSLKGGTLNISLVECDKPIEEDIANDESGLAVRERVLRLDLNIKWDIGEAGTGGGLKAGDLMKASDIHIDAQSLSMDDLLSMATRTHAAYLTRHLTSPLLASPRIALFPLHPPSLIEDISYTSSIPLSLRVPLPSRQKLSSLSVGVSALTGLVEIEDGGGTDVRMARAKMASVSVNDQKSRLLDDVGRLITAVITESLESQMRQLGWSPTRRLALRSQDLAKNDLHPASSIFVPLPTSSVHYLVAKVILQGIAFELLKLSKIPADGGVGFKLAIGDRSPMDLVRLRVRRTEREQASNKNTNGAAGDVTQSDTSSNFEIENRDLRDLFIFCNALVSQTIVEQQLKDRSIPYTLQYPPMSGAGSAKSTSAVAGMVPTICVNARDLLKDGRAGDVAFPRVYMQIRDWWKGGKCRVDTVVQLRHKPALSSHGTSPSPVNGSQATTARAEGITFDQASSVVRFQATDISRCVPSFLEQWERLSKVIVVAGEVNWLNKSDAFRDLKMLSFDLRTATFSYAPGYNASITYTPQDDSYEVSFTSEHGDSPHTKLAGLLSHRLNEMALNGIKQENGKTGREFLTLLRDTLPLLKEVDLVRKGEFPELVVRSVASFRLIWDVEAITRYALDITLVPSDRFLVMDGSISTDGTCGPITPIPNFEDVVSSVFDELKQGRKQPVAMRLDSGTSLVCEAAIIGEVVRNMVGQVRTKIGLV